MAGENVLVRGIFKGSRDQYSGYVQVINSPIPQVKPGYYIIPINQMDIVQQPDPNNPVPPETPLTVQDPYDYLTLKEKTQEVIDYIEELKRTGVNLPPIDFGPSWGQVSIEDYLNEFSSKYEKNLQESNKEYYEKNLQEVTNRIARKTQEVVENTARLNKATSKLEIAQLKNEREVLMQQLAQFISDQEYIESRLADQTKMPVLLDPLFQKQLKLNMRDVSIYRRGNVTLLVPPEYRHTPKRMREAVQLIERLQDQYGTKNPIELNMFTWSPGILDSGDGRDGSAWNTMGWATNSNLADAFLANISGYPFLLGRDREMNHGIDEYNQSWYSPAAYVIPGVLYSLAHEWGHLRDFDSADENSPDPFSGITKKLEEFFSKNPELKRRLVSRYGQSLSWEMASELFAQIFLQENFEIDNVDFPQEILDILKS